MKINTPFAVAPNSHYPHLNALHRIAVLFFAAVLMTTTAWANNPDPSEGWKHFANNDYDKAKAAFKKDLNGSSKADAYLGLSLIGSATGDEALTQESFYKFYDETPNKAEYATALWSMGSGKKTDKELDYLKKLTQLKDLRIVAMAENAYGSHHYSSNKMSDAAAAYAKTGTITTWQSVGEFENISESGFDKDFGALAHPEPDYLFKNKRGADVKWFDLKTSPSTSWVHLNYHFYVNDAIVYLQNFCNSPKEQEVEFRLGTSGSVKVWVNDQLLFSEAKERNNDIDTYLFTAKLMKGHNRILMQLGSSEVSSSNFLMRIADMDGNLVDGLSYTTKLQDYPKNYSYKSTVVSDYIEEFFLNKIKNNPASIEPYLSLVQYYNHNERIYKAKKTLKEAKKRFPDCTYVNYQLILAYARDDNDNAVSTYLEEIKTKDPNNPIALQLLYEEAFEREDFDEAKRLFKIIEKNNLDQKDIYAKKMAMAGQDEEIEKLIKLVDEAYAKYPEDLDFLGAKYYIEKEARKNNSGATKILQKYLKKNYDEDIVTTLASDYFDAGNISKGLAELEKLVKNKPNGIGYYKKIAGVHTGLSNYKEAEKYIKKCLEIAPYVSSYHSSLATVYEQQNKKKDAVKALKTAIYYNSYDYDAREQLRKLEGEKDNFSNFAEEDVYKIFKNAPDGKDYPEDQSIILVDDVRKVIYENGGSEEKHTLLAKVFNSSGVDSWKEYYIPAYRNQNYIIEKAEVLKKDGAKVTAQTSGRHIVFPNLEEGDGIHVTFKLQNYYSGKLSNHFWGKHYFELFLPMKSSRYSLLIPRNKKFDYETLNFDLEPKKTSVGNNDLYIWEVADVPSIKYEPYMSEMADVANMLHLSSFEDWDYIAEWYADLAQAKAKDDFEVKEAVNEIFEGKAGLTEKQKVREIYNYIVNEIRYISVPFLQSGLVPQKSGYVLSSKQGDCKDVSSLFVAMCKTQGIDANLVLVNTRDEGQKAMALPSIGFNHCIAKINMDNEDYFIELTAENLPFASGSSSVDGAFVLEIPQDANTKAMAKVIDPPTRVRNNVVRISDVSFNGDKMTVDKLNTKTGTYASSMRYTYENDGEEERFKTMQKAINDDFANVKLLELDLQEGIEGNSDAVKYRYKYEVPSVFTEIGGMSIFKLPWADGFETPDFLTTEERKYPIEFWNYTYADEKKEVLTISIPTGKTVSEVPESQSYSSKTATYSMTFKQSGNQLIATRTFKVLQDVVQPEDYVEFKDFMTKVIKADSQQLAFR